MTSNFQTRKRPWRTFSWDKGITVYSSFLFSWLVFFFRKLFKKYLVYFILILHKVSFKMRGHMAIFWNLVQGVIFYFTQLGKIGDTGEFLLFENDLPSFFGRVLGPLSEKPKVVSRYKFFYGTLLQSLAYCWRIKIKILPEPLDKVKKNNSILESSQWSSIQLFLKNVQILSDFSVKY